MTRIIAISTNKGGVLKSSITGNLAGVLSEDSKVLVVDTDNQGNATLSFGIQPDYCDLSTYDLMVKETDPGRIIKKINDNIDIIPSNDDMSFLEFEVLTNTQNFDKPFQLLKRGLSNIKDKYDYILIDTPPNLGLTQGNVLAAADEILIPFQPEPFSMRSLGKMLQAVEKFRVNHNPFLKVLGVVGTLIDNRTVLHSDIMQKCRRFCYENDVPMFDTEIQRVIRYAESVAKHGLPATLTTKRPEYVQPYYDLKGEIVNV